jgi:hypothetical protein
VSATTTMDLHNLLEKPADNVFLRKLIGFTA